MWEDRSRRDSGGQGRRALLAVAVGLGAPQVLQGSSGGCKALLGALQAGGGGSGRQGGDLSLRGVELALGLLTSDPRRGLEGAGARHGRNGVMAWPDPAGRCSRQACCTGWCCAAGRLRAHLCSLTSCHCLESPLCRAVRAGLSSLPLLGYDVLRAPQCCCLAGALTTRHGRSLWRALVPGRADGLSGAQSGRHRLHAGAACRADVQAGCLLAGSGRLPGPSGLLPPLTALGHGGTRPVAGGACPRDEGPGSTRRAGSPCGPPWYTARDSNPEPTD